MQTKFLNSLEKRYQSHYACPCTQLRPVSRLDDDGNTYEVSVCRDCRKEHTNNQYQHSLASCTEETRASNDQDDTFTSLDDDLYLDKTPVFRTPKQYRARYRTIRAKQFITLRNDGIEYSGSFSPELIKLVEDNQDYLRADVTISLDEFISHLTPSGNLYKVF